MKTKTEPAQLRPNMMPTHALSLLGASPFLDDVIISQAVEKKAKELEAMFKHNNMCFYPESSRKSVGDVLLSD